jgi:hypothetical protein
MARHAGVVARQACAVATTSPVHGRRPGKARRDLTGAAELIGVDGGTRAAQQFSGDLRGTTVERVNATGTTGMRWHSVLTGASDGVDGGVGEDSGVARSDTRVTAHDMRRAAGLSGHGHRRWCGQDGGA